MRRTCVGPTAGCWLLWQVRQVHDARGIFHWRTFINAFIHVCMCTKEPVELSNVGPLVCSQGMCS